MRSVMARPRFSEMLLDRRRQLGLSAQQASKVLKLKELVLVAFEEGDWEHIPQSGYAQGMPGSRHPTPMGPCTFRAARRPSETSSPVTSSTRSATR